ncbi:hypothetical protein J4403_00925 [Candidatus Woesearchaeota archaeon]|nr:hypothetical protein [Candidatus Woesearchaeota archaeon]
MKKGIFSFLILLILVPMTMTNTGCGMTTAPPKSASGVSKANVKVPTDVNNLTREQKNVGRRLLDENKPGAVQHLYIISAYSGQVLIYSTVKGKVTSSGKRLSPYTVSEGGGCIPGDPFPVNIGGETRYTAEVLQDDGTYGSSDEYLFWWDTKGIYHQHYIEDGQIIHISDQPIAVKSVIINMELTSKEEGS